MKKYIADLKKKFRGISLNKRYTIMFLLGIFVTFSVFASLSFADWFLYHRIPQSSGMSTQLKSNNGTPESILNTDGTVQSPSITKQEIVQPNGNSVNSISEADKAKTDDLKEQLRLAEEMEKQTKEGLANLKKTLSEQTITPPPTLKPLPTTKAPEPITVKPLPSQPTEVCRSWTETPYGKTCSRTEIIFK